MSQTYREGAAWHTSIQCSDLSSRYIVLPGSAALVLIWNKDETLCATSAQFCAFLEGVKQAHPCRHILMQELTDGIEIWDEQARWYAVDWLIAKKLIRIFKTREEAELVGTSMTEPPTRKPGSGRKSKKHQQGEQAA